MQKIFIEVSELINICYTNERDDNDLRAPLLFFSLSVPLSFFPLFFSISFFRIITVSLSLCPSLFICVYTCVEMESIIARNEYHVAVL